MTKTWGPHIWLFFHGIVEMAREEKFKYHKKQLLDFIKQICNNLPCDICSKHARDYMKKFHYSRIKDKEHMKKILFDFHNEVNKRTGKQIFTDYDKYKTIRLEPIVKNFVTIFTKSISKVNGFSNGLYRKKITDNILKYLNIHQKDFIWL